MRWAFFIVPAGLLAYLFLQASSHYASYALPTFENPLELYFTELRAPLRSVILESIRGAKNQLLVVIYQLRDEEIIEAIREKSESGVPTYVVVDVDGYDEGRKLLGKKTTLIKRQSPGIMHQKIVVTDKSQIYLGSTNFTFESLNLHANDWVGIYSPSLAEKIWQRVKKMDKKGRIEPGFAIHANLGTSPVEMWFTPHPEALKKLGQLIDQAQVSIDVAMFTFTHPELAQKLVEARLRGVQVTVATDAQQARKVNKLALESLKEGREYLGAGLFHHKFALIDGHTLAIGSLNWTKQAFTQNDDCFIIIYQLAEKQKILLNQVWEVILQKTRENTYAFGATGIRQDGQVCAHSMRPLWPYGDGDRLSQAPLPTRGVSYPRGRPIFGLQHA